MKLFKWHISFALIITVSLHTSIQIQLEGAICIGLLSDVYSKSKPTGQYEKVASAGGQIYVGSKLGFFNSWCTTQFKLCPNQSF
jgi:hypothetical protein